MEIRKAIILTLAILVASCAALTPGIKIETDPYYDTTQITQPPVSAAASMSESWHTLGFWWSQKNPNEVVLIVGVQGIDNITDVEFKIDGQTTSTIKKFDRLTAYADSRSGWSTRNFSISLDEFKKLETAKDVKMKVESIDTYTVSSFGLENKGALVNSKIKPFIDAIKNINN